MKKSESFIEDRIRWRSQNFGLPTMRTCFWDSIIKKPDIDLQSELGKPVLVSLGNGTNFIVVCTFGVIINYNDKKSVVKYTDMKGIYDVPMEVGEEKADLTHLVIRLNTGEEKIVCPEPYKPAFAIWSILIMLLKIS
ncbi:hypothetical protein H0A36_07280 [Endozoicomonas sp. SM1973]|uniref:Uncharacterized protein n=1 Tax=Spartinivicinus marinus TaxID=2994442 RepID=A0A853I2U3_9GAMM|nr:hypothetical protein [Spartinivicinus marinus]MCX4029279.1 hypothetical protein [Spartinivicinus marinus]NYZ65812.1 hypothetical protein [Spartinivicinus marinus]